MRGLAARSLLSLLAALGLGAQPGPRAPAQGPLRAGRDLLTAARYPEAAEAFQAHLGGLARSRFTIRLAVYCDVSHLDRHLRGSETPPELFLLRRTVSGQACYGLYWGLFSSQAEAQAALGAVPLGFRTPDRALAAVSAILPPAGTSMARPAPPPSPPAPAPAQTATRGLQAPPQPEPRVVSPPSTRAQPLPETPPIQEDLPRRGLSPTLADLVRPATIPRVEVAARYSYLWDDLLSRALKLGWSFSAGASVGDRLAVVAEVSRHYGSARVASAAVSLGSAQVPSTTAGRPRVLALHAGLRYTDRDDRVAAPYVQVLGGATRLSPSLVDASASETHLSIQPGVGLTFRLSDTMGLGLGGDYRWVRRPERNARDANEFRLHGGFVLGLGERGSPLSPRRSHAGNKEGSP